MHLCIYININHTIRCFQMNSVGALVFLTGSRSITPFPRLPNDDIFPTGAHILVRRRGVAKEDVKCEEMRGPGCLEDGFFSVMTVWIWISRETAWHVDRRNKNYIHISNMWALYMSQHWVSNLEQFKRVLANILVHSIRAMEFDLSKRKYISNCWIFHGCLWKTGGHPSAYETWRPCCTGKIVHITI